MTKEVQHNNILVISDPQKAAEDKIKVDMARRKAALPSKITGIILLLFILAGGISYVVHKFGYLDYSWCVLIWCITAFPAIIWFVAWASQKYIPYSPNTIYWMATAKGNVQKMYISKERTGRYAWPATLDIFVQQENGKIKETSVDLGFGSYRCNDITQDIIDLTIKPDEGMWFEPAHKRQEHVLPIKKWVEYYAEGVIKEFENEENED